MKMEVDEWVGRHWNLTSPLRASPSTAWVWHFRILWQTRASQAEVAKLADAPDLGSGGAILRGSSPLLGKTSTIHTDIGAFSRNVLRSFFPVGPERRVSTKTTRTGILKSGRRFRANSVSCRSDTGSLPSFKTT